MSEQLDQKRRVFDSDFFKVINDEASEGLCVCLKVLVGRHVLRPDAANGLGPRSFVDPAR
jgi:hypothetical protein